MPGLRRIPSPTFSQLAFGVELSFLKRSKGSVADNSDTIRLTRFKEDRYQKSPPLWGELIERRFGDCSDRRMRRFAVGVVLLAITLVTGSLTYGGPFHPGDSVLA